MKHKLFTLLVALVASIGSLYASYVNPAVKIGNYYYELDANTQSAKLVAPDDGKYTLSSVTIPGSVTSNNTTYRVTSIGGYAFEKCTNLTSISIGKNVTSIGERAFYECTNLSSVSMGSKVETIGERAFYECANLMSIELPNTVTYIGEFAFYGCTNLTSIEIPNSVNSIGEWAFNTTISVIIGSGVTSIGGAAFCSATSIIWNAKNCADFTYNNSATSLPFGSDVTSFVIGEGVETLPAYMCYCMRKLTSINIPSSVTKIGGKAFLGCNNMTLNEIPNSVTSIGEQAFYDCSSLTSITIPNAVTKIYSGVFEGCSGLTSVTIPNSVTSIGERAFYDCRGLTSITIPNSVIRIQESAFNRCTSLISITIGNGITTIKDYAFRYCNNLTSFTIMAETPPTGGGNSGIPNESCTLYVPDQAVETYSNTIWWEDFQEILPIPVHNTAIVTFLDWDGTILSQTEVEIGTAAVAPTNPIREGYTFIGWDKDFSSITENLTITALYELGENHNISFVFTNSIDGSEILDQIIVVKIPAAPTIEGFTFIKWIIVGRDLEDEVKIQAVYEAEEPTSAPAIYTNPTNPTQKLIRNGNVYILTDDKTYTVTGHEVR